MPKKLSSKQRKLLEFLQGKNAGDVVTLNEMLEHTTYAKSALETYIGKNYAAPFLSSIDNNSYEVLRNGSDVTEQSLIDSFTQVRPELYQPKAGMTFVGEHASYKLQTRLGNGAVGEVWRCSSTNSSDKALKILNPRIDLLDPEHIGNVRQRFSREARNGMQLSHPNLLAYRDYGEENGHPFIAFDLADRSVGAMLKTGPVSLEVSCKILHSCLLALGYLHSKNHVHRDIKPDNILQFGNRFALADLGIVKWSDMNSNFISAGTITRASVQLGSWHYMAREQRQSPHEATSASDVHALGVSWYEMLTNNILDPAAAGAGDLPPFTNNNSAVADLIKRMVSYQPSNRPSVQEILGTMPRMNE